VKQRRSAKSTTSLRARIAELERERELLNAIANYAPSLICLVDAEGRVRPYASNKAFERTLGYQPHETGGVHFWERYVPDGERATARDCILTAIRTGASECEGRWLQRDGGEIDVAWSCTSLPKIESGPVFLITGTDITDRKRHEAEVRRSRSRIVTAADDARRRLERNLHDGAQQRLIALLLQLRHAQRGGHDSNATLEEAVGELAAAVKELRELAQGIHPSALSERGLAAALRIVASRAPLPVELDVTDTPLETYRDRLDATLGPSTEERKGLKGVAWPPMVARVLAIVGAPKPLREILKMAARGGATSAGDVLRAVEVLLAARLVSWR